MTRTFQSLFGSDLEEICAQARTELDRFLTRAGNPPSKFQGYAQRLIAICLAQGTAQQFVDLQAPSVFDNEVVVSAEKIAEKGHQVFPSGQVISGIKDIDVWFFFAQDDLVPIPSRQHCKKSVTTRFKNLGERRLDFMKKGVSETLITRITNPNPKAIVRSYLQDTEHGQRYLSKKSLVGLYPASVFSEIFWATRRWTNMPTPQNSLWNKA